VIWCFITNLSVCWWKNFFKLVNIWHSYGQNGCFMRPIHLDSPCVFSSTMQNSLDGQKQLLIVVMLTGRFIWLYCQQISNFWRPDLTYWLTDWCHVRHFAATSFFLVVSVVCMQWFVWFLIWLMWASFCWGTKYCWFHQTHVLKQFLSGKVLHGISQHLLLEHGDFWTYIFHKVP